MERIVVSIRMAHDWDDKTFIIHEQPRAWYGFGERLVAKMPSGPLTTLLVSSVPEITYTRCYLARSRAQLGRTIYHVHVTDHAQALSAIRRAITILLHAARREGYELELRP